MKLTPLEHWISRKIGNGRERLTREKIEGYQLSKLRETIGMARAHSPFYRKHLAGLTEEGLSTLDDLACFPFTTAEDLRTDPLRFLCVSQSDVSRVVTLDDVTDDVAAHNVVTFNTSGTTGHPKRIYFTGEDQLSTIDFFHHGMSTLAGPGERVLILLPGERPGSVGYLLRTALERLGACAIPHGPVRDVSHTLEVMERENPDALVGIPVQVLSLARCCQGRAAPKAVLLSTDHVPMAIRRELERIWGCEVFGHYGMTEMGFGGGVECAARSGYHMREADLLFEIVHLETGRSVSQGEWGEVVFTTLTRRGMPFIRYRTGDLGRFLLNDCACGTVLKTMDRISGRLAGHVRIGETGTLTMADLDEALFPIAGLLDFRATLTGREGVDILSVTLDLMERKGEEAEAVAPAVREALNAIPSIKAARLSGKLEISVDVPAPGATILKTAAKRRIMDTRHTEGLTHEHTASNA